MVASVGRTDVVVIGAGIIGVSSALHLARLGARVTIVTESGLASGASGRSLAWINSARFRSAEYHRLRMIGIDRYRTFSGRSEGFPWLQFAGGLTWGPDNASNRIAETCHYEQSIGYDSQLLSPADVANRTPGINVSAISPQGAIFNPGEGWVDLPSLIQALVVDYQALGGHLIVDAGKVAVDVSHGHTTGISTESGLSLKVDRVLVATGAAVPCMSGDVGYLIPDSSPTALLVKTKPFKHAIRAVLNTPNVALRPTPDGAIVVDSGWSERQLSRSSDDPIIVPREMLNRLLAEASNVLDGNPKLELESYHCGPKPVPGDGDPVIGALQGIPGYFVAFSHSGATLGLIIGELIAREIMTGEASPLLEKFRPSRFKQIQSSVPL